jgi:hypothetical protein
MKKVIFGLCMLVSTSAMAEWTTVGVNTDTGEPLVAIDYTRTFNSHGIIYTWFKDFTMGRLKSIDNPGYHPMNLYRTQVNCQSRMVKNDFVQVVLVKQFHYTSDRIELDSTGPFTKWYVPDPGSVHEFVVKQVCKLK